MWSALLALNFLSTVSAQRLTTTFTTRVCCSARETHSASRHWQDEGSAQCTSCAPLPHLHFLPSKSTARGRHAAAHDAQWHTRRKLREHVTEGRRWFFPLPLHSRRLPRAEPRCRLHELERVHNWRAKLRGRLQCAVGDEGKWRASASEAIGKRERDE